MPEIEFINRKKETDQIINSLLQREERIGHPEQLLCEEGSISSCQEIKRESADHLVLEDSLCFCHGNTVLFCELPVIKLFSFYMRLFFRFFFL